MQFSRLIRNIKTDTVLSRIGAFASLIAAYTGIHSLAFMEGGWWNPTSPIATVKIHYSSNDERYASKFVTKQYLENESAVDIELVTHTILLDSNSHPIQFDTYIDSLTPKKIRIRSDRGKIVDLVSEVRPTMVVTCFLSSSLKSSETFYDIVTYVPIKEFSEPTKMVKFVLAESSKDSYMEKCKRELR